MTKRKTLCDQRLIDYVLGLYYYYEPCYVINHRLWGLQYQNLERILPRVFLFGSLWFAWTLCVFCYFAFFNLSSQQSVTCTDKVHTFAHIQINNANETAARTGLVNIIWCSGMCTTTARRNGFGVSVLFTEMQISKNKTQITDALISESIKSK